MPTNRPKARLLAGFIVLVFLASGAPLCCWADLCHSKSRCSFHQQSRGALSEEPTFCSADEDAVCECPIHECLRQPGQIPIPPNNPNADSCQKASRSANAYEIAFNLDSLRNIICMGASHPYSLDGSNLIAKKCAFLS